MSPQPQKKGRRILVNKIIYKERLKKIEWLVSYQDIGLVAFENSSNYFTCSLILKQVSINSKNNSWISYFVRFEDIWIWKSMKQAEAEWCQAIVS